MTHRRFMARDPKGSVLEVQVHDSLVFGVSPSQLPTGEADALPWITRGLFDLQVNGALGVSFNDPQAPLEDISRAVRHCVANGMTGILATLVTTDRDSISQSLDRLEKARQADPLVEKVIEGYHIEGPAISPLDGYRGAHPSEHVRVPSRGEYEEWKAASNNRLKLITVAPELPGVPEWIAQLTHDRITVAIGHTAADSLEIQRAVLAGARISTHLGNGCASLIDRHSNPIWPQLAEARLASSLILDGYHVPEPFARTVFRCKPPGNLILTCDASPLAGLPPGEYSLWGKTLHIDPEGRVVVPGTPYLAGSGHFLNHCLRNALGSAEWLASDILDAATSVPRSILGLPQRELAVGQQADLVLWRGPCLAKARVEAVCVLGEWHFQEHEPRKPIL